MNWQHYDSTEPSKICLHGKVKAFERCSDQNKIENNLKSGVILVEIIWHALHICQGKGI